MDLIGDLSDPASRNRLGNYSEAWQYFDRSVDQDNQWKVRCKLCGNLYALPKSKSTSNMIAHLRMQHRILLGKSEAASFLRQNITDSLVQSFGGVNSPSIDPSTGNCLNSSSIMQLEQMAGAFQFPNLPPPGNGICLDEARKSLLFMNPVLRVKEEEMDEDLEFVESPNQRLEMLQQWAEAGPMPSEKEDAAANSRAAECSQTNEVVVNNEQVQGIKTLSPEPSPSSSAHYHPYSPKPALPSSSTQFEVKEQPNLPTSSLNNLVVKSEEQQQQQPVDARASILADLVRQQGLRLLASDPKKFDTFWTDVIMAVAKSN